MESLGLNSLEAMATLSGSEGKYKSRIEAVKEACAGIYKKYKKRELEISENADGFMAEKVVDLQYNLRKSVRQTLEELVRGRGFLAEIAAVKLDLEKEAPRTEIQTLTQTLKEIELRKLMRAAGKKDFSMKFQAAVIDGDPLRNRNSII